jgi:hypothetical protein
MRQLTAWGVYDSMIDTVTKANAIIADKTKDTEEDAAKSEKAGL